MKDSNSDENASMSGATPRRWKIKRILLYVVLPLGLLGFAFLFLNWGLRRVLNPEETFSTYEVPYTQDFSDVTIKRWFTKAGEWVIRDGALAQVGEAVEDAHLFVPYWLKVGFPYRYSIQITMSESAQAAGLIFNAQYPEIYSAHHKVVVARRGDQLEVLSGPVNGEDGFQPEASVSIPGNMETFRLEVVVGEDTYDVLINGLTVLEGRPLAYKNGILGMVAEGGLVAYDNMSLTTVEDTAYGAELVSGEGGLKESDYFVVGDLVYSSDFSGVSGTTGWTPFKGEWQVKNAALTQLDPAEYDAGIGYEGGVFERYALQVTLTHLEGTGGGVLFGMLSPYQHAGAHVVRYSDTGDAVLWGHFDNGGKFIGQGFANIEAPGDATHIFKILSGDHAYAIYLDNEPVAQDIPLFRKNGYVGLITSLSAVAYPLVEVFDLLSDLGVSEDKAALSTPQVATGEAATTTPQAATSAVAASTPQVATGQAAPSALPVATGGAAVTTMPAATGAAASQTATIPTAGAGRAADGGPIYSGDFATAAWKDGWISISGNWQATDGLLTQLDARVFDAAIGYRGNTFRSYALQVALAHKDGSGGGLLFNMPAPDQLKGAHMVRYSDTANGIFWGSYDEIGNFVGQGYAKVEAPGTATHTMRVVSSEASYAIYLDERLIASEIPLIRNQGHIGLLTARCAVAFGPIEVFSLAGDAQARSPGTGVGNLLKDAQSISGDWTVDGSVIRQENSSATDFILNTGVSADVYDLSVTVTLPDDPELQNAGAGIIFHMPEPNVKNSAHLVRVADGGKGVFWGHFDENQVFVGEGWSAFAREGSKTFDLQIVVRSDNYDLLVNGYTIASKVPLQRQDGWIGLLAFRGPIVFEDLQITAGGQE